jgi:GTPase Era involved in 16S rRNA processing
MREINIYYFSDTKEIFDKIFVEKGEILEKNYGSIETRLFPKKESFLSSLSGLFMFPKLSDQKIHTKWIGYKYPNLSDDNKNAILNDLMVSIKDNKNKNNIVIKFGQKYAKVFRKLSNNFDTDHPFILFNFSENDEIENGFFEKFKYPQYISYIKDKYDPNTPDLNYHKIISYIWEKDCYYNERGNSSCPYSPANLLYKPSKGFIFCNILLIGESRAGKSTFINRLFNKYMSHESAKFESTTKEITYYEFSFQDVQEEKDNNKLIKNGYGLIRVLDTPGLVLTKDLDASSKIIEKLNKEFDNIHMIYFFLKGQSNIEQSLNLLKYIKKKNVEREKNKAYKVPIIFIKNGEDLVKGGNGNVLFQELKNSLKKNDLVDLYDSFDEKNNNKEPNAKINFDSDDEENENFDDYQNYIDGNIIQVNLLTGKNLNKLFLISKNYIFKNNNKILGGELDDEYKIMNDKALSLVKLYIKEKLEKKPLTKRDKDSYKELYKVCNEFAHKLQNSGSILYNLDILNVKTDPTFYHNLALCTLPFFIFIIPYFIAICCVVKINKNLLSNIALNFGFSEKDIYSYGLDKYVFTEEILKDANEKSENSNEKIKKFFANIIYYTGPIQCAIKTREALNQINDMFDKLSNRKDEEWKKFKVEKI